MSLPKKSLLIFSFFFITSLFPLFSAETEIKWTLAAEKFVFTQKKMTGGANEASSSVLPSLILEQIAENLTRLPRAREQLDRIEYDLQKERTSLFLQLSKEVQTRDALVLQDYSQGKLKRKIKEQQKKIDEVQKKIDANLASVDEERKKKEKQILLDEERERRIEQGHIVNDSEENTDFFKDFFKNFVPAKDEKLPELEKVVIYKNNVTELFNAGEEASSQGYTSFAFAKAASDAGIRGLITGQITIYGSYIAVSCLLYQYPGGRVIGSASDVGSMSELKSLAVRLASQITPKISDSMPVKLVINVTPPQAKASLVLTLDDVVYTENISELTVSSGVHFIQFASKGYDTEATSFAFQGNRVFNISVDMQEQSKGSVQLAFTRAIEGDVFADGMFRKHVTSTDRFSSIRVDNKPVLGHFVSKDGFPSEFIIQKSLLEKDSLLQVQEKAFDKSLYIDKRRIWMYRSYSALIVSLMPQFFFRGNYESAVNAYNSNKYTDENQAISKINTYRACDLISSGISIGCAAWFLVELVRYLNAANSVLPVEAKALKEKGYQKIKAQEEAAKSAENAESNKNTENAEISDEKQEE